MSNPWFFHRSMSESFDASGTVLLGHKDASKFNAVAAARHSVGGFSQRHGSEVDATADHESRSDSDYNSVTATSGNTQSTNLISAANVVTLAGPTQTGLKVSWESDPVRNHQLYQRYLKITRPPVADRVPPLHRNSDLISCDRLTLLGKPNAIGESNDNLAQLIPRLVASCLVTIFNCIVFD